MREAAWGRRSVDVAGGGFYAVIGEDDVVPATIADAYLSVPIIIIAP